MASEAMSSGATFITLIKEFRLNHDDLNKKLEKCVIEEMGKTDRVKSKLEHSNIKGWQSERDLHAKLGDSTPMNLLLLQLFNSFNGPINEYIKACSTRFNIKPSEAYEWNYTGSWFNVAVNGSYNAPHTHPLSQISGAYYVRTEEPPADHPFSGRIDFFPQNVNRHFFPKAGTLILFPGPMLHFVHPYYGSGHRICLSFNTNNIHELKS